MSTAPEVRRTDKLMRNTPRGSKSAPRVDCTGGFGAEGEFAAVRSGALTRQQYPDKVRLFGTGFSRVPFAYKPINEVDNILHGSDRHLPVGHLDFQFVLENEHRLDDRQGVYSEVLERARRLQLFNAETRVVGDDALHCSKRTHALTTGPKIRAPIPAGQILANSADTESAACSLHRSSFRRSSHARVSGNHTTVQLTRASDERLTTCFLSGNPGFAPLTSINSGSSSLSGRTE